MESWPRAGISAPALRPSSRSASRWADRQMYRRRSLCATDDQAKPLVSFQTRKVESQKATLTLNASETRAQNTIKILALVISILS
jgi:hypothetical protein